MDRWDDDDAMEVARDLQRGFYVGAFQPPSATANCGNASAPMAVLDALIETAWSFPGFRISFAAFDGPRAIRFCTSAGAESMASLDGVRLDLSDAPRLVEALANVDTPIVLEDVGSDSRSRPLAGPLAAIDCRSALVLPLHRDHEKLPFGVVMMDRDAPRTWGAKEGAALDRLAPIVALAIEHIQARAELQSSKTNAERHERLIDALRGRVAGVAADAARIVQTLQANTENGQRGTQSLLAHLGRLVDELDRIQRGPSIITQPFDLSSALRELVPGLQALTSAQIRVEDSVGHAGVMGNRAGIERLLVNLVTHSSGRATTSKSLTFELRGDLDRPKLSLRGDALVIDEALRQVGQGDQLTASVEIDAGLWQARCEALVQDIRLRVDRDSIVLEFQPAELAADAEKNAG